MYATPFYAALLAIVFYRLSVGTIKLRRQLKIAIGAGGNPRLHRAMRVHGNFSEYVPMALLLLLLFEIQGGHYLVAHLFGLCLLLGRLAHAYGVSREKEDYRYRVAGMVMTFAALVGSVAGILILYVLELSPRVLNLGH